jgi:nitroimidazol reductase NimA-like FMN-containing flavoprotein (pyridoxamine 5'-phosphate oxidase superfamily)
MNQGRKTRSLESSRVAALMEGITKPARLASISPNGFPLISTIWFLYEAEAFWCITQQGTLMRRNLSRNPRCAFEFSLENERYKVLRGQGLAELSLQDGPRVTELMIARYLADPNGVVANKLRDQVDTEYAIRIRPRWVRVQGRA